MRKKNLAGQILICIFFAALCFLIVFPFWLLVSASLSNSGVLAVKGYQVWPSPVDFSSYAYVFKNPDRILRAYGVTASFSVCSMILSVMQDMV